MLGSEHRNEPPSAQSIRARDGNSDGVHHSALILLCAALAAVSSPAQAQPASTGSGQPYPTKPVRLIIPIAAGGGPDTIGRAVAMKLTDNLGQTMVVDNRAGASGAIAVEAASQAAPDGYTILLISASQVIRPLLFKVPYDLFRDFAPITQLSSQSYVLMASPKLPVKSVSELVAYARANPGKLNYGSVGNGSQIHLMTELFRTMTRIQAVHVPYKGMDQAYPDLFAGNIQFMFGSVITSQPPHQGPAAAGAGGSGPKRIKAFPELPTVAEAGVKGFAVTQWYGLLAPAGTPRDDRRIPQQGNQQDTAAARRRGTHSCRGLRGGRQHAAAARRPHQGRAGQVGEGDQGRGNQGRVIDWAHAQERPPHRISIPVRVSRPFPTRARQRRRFPHAADPRDRAVRGGRRTDLLARFVSPRLGELLGQQIVVDNRGGAGSVLGTQVLANSAPDGYTLGVFDTAFAINPSIVDKLPYNSERDFVFIAIIATSPSLLVTHPGLKVRSIQELVARAKSQPGRSSSPPPAWVLRAT